MNYYTPYVITFFSTLAFTYILASYSFIHQDIRQLFNISKTEFGFTYGVSFLASAVGCLVYFKDTPKIKSNVVWYYSWGVLGLCFFYSLVLIAAELFQNPHKIILYISVVGVGYCRSYLFTSILIMMKIHKQKSIQYSISQNQYKFLMTVWCSKYDLGFAVGFFIANIIKYVLNYDWKIVLFLAILLNILILVILYIFLKQYLTLQNQFTKNDHQSIIPKPQENQQSKKIGLDIFLNLIKQDQRCKLFLWNVIILDMIHLGVGMIFPPYFFEIGYAGNEGQLLVLFSLSMVFGTWMLALVDFYVNKWMKQKKQGQQTLLKGFKEQEFNKQPGRRQSDNKEQIRFPYISTIFLFMFFMSSLIFLLNSFKGDDFGLKGQKDYNMDLILMCCVGFFYGGPAQNYINYHVLKIVNQMQTKYQNKYTENTIKCVQTLNDDYQKIQNSSKTALNTQPSLQPWYKSLLTTRYQIGSALISFILVIDFIGTIPFFIISFIIIQYYIHLLFLLLTLMSIITVMIDYRLNVGQQKVILIKNVGKQYQCKQLQNITNLK